MAELRSPSRAFRGAALKLPIMVLAVLCRTYLPYMLLGLWTRMFGGWQSVFFCYAGSDSFTRAYAPRWAVPLFRWCPSPIGMLVQNDERGLVLAAPLTEAEFVDPANASAFRQLQKRIDRIARIIGVKDVHMAGVLPSVLRDQTELNIPDTRPVIVASVRFAVQEIAAQLFPQSAPALIVLGGAGYVGAPVTQNLRAAGYECHVVDPKLQQDKLPAAVRGRPAVLIDISRFGAIDGYISQMWPGLVVLNEAFPRPARDARNAMAASGVTVFHLSGVAGRVIPPLPYGYEGAVPCCAAHAPPEPGDVRVICLNEPTVDVQGPRSIRAAE